MPRPRLRLRTLLVLVAILAAGMFVVRTNLRWNAFRSHAQLYAAREQESLALAARMDRQAQGLARAGAGQIVTGDEAGMLPDDFARYFEFYRLQADYYAGLKDQLLRRWW